MSSHHEQSGLMFIKGLTRIFTVELLALPLGMLVAVILTRSLGPEIYGLYALAVALLFWLEMVTAFTATRSTEYFVATVDDWQPFASFILRVHLAGGLAGGLLLFCMAPLAAGWFNHAQLATPLRILAVDVLIFGLAVAHRNILVGLGRYRPRAYAPLARWLTRLALVVLLVGLGFGINGAAWAIVGGSFAELVLYRFCVRPPFWLKPSNYAKMFFRFSAPLFIHSISINLLRQLDLVMIGVLLPSTHWAGFYGAALNLCLPARVFSLSLTPLLNSNLSRLNKQGQADLAKQRIGQAFRILFYLLPIAGVAASSGPELMVLLFGQDYAQAAVPFTYLVFAYWAQLAIDAGSALLVAKARPGPAMGATVWLPLSAMGGCTLLIPGMGGLGAAIATTVTSLAGFVVSIFLVARIWQVRFPWLVFFKSLLICGALFGLGSLWYAPGFLVLAKILLLLILVALGFIISGELKGEQIERALPLAVVRRFGQR